ncbi:leucine-rich repeat-containing protein 70-like [Melanaphis sacchari]|nr:leucine-rich repeat-containing protein 70-like [Melanaphis sacchari]
MAPKRKINDKHRIFKEDWTEIFIFYQTQWFWSNVASCVLIIIVTCVASGESILCDTCTCRNSVINCTENGMMNILDLWDHTEIVNNATIMHFNYNGIVHVKQLPPSKVSYLSFRKNKINKIDEMAFMNLEFLLELDLSYNSLTAESLNPDIFKINYEDISKPGRLIHLRLDYNNIHSLLPHTFKELSNLVSLTLSGNPLTVIDRSTSFALSSLPMLKILSLSNTSLHELPDHLLHTPRFLEILNLSNNKFTQIPQGLEEAHALQKLNFNSNPIKSILNFPKMASLTVLHLSHMPELNNIGPHAFSLLNVLEEFHCAHNNKLESIDPTAFSYKFNEGLEGELWPPIKKLDLSYNALGYLDSRLLGRWDTLEELNLQGNKWICDCVNQWLVSTLAPMVKSNHPEFLNDFTCQVPIEMSGISILDLDHRHYHMRCLDFYNNRPERDGILLIGILIGVILTVPFTMGIMICCAKRKNSLSYYHRIFNQNKSPYVQDYQLRETSIYQPTSIINEGY